MTEQELEEIEKRANAATPGPWEFRRLRSGVSVLDAHAIAARSVDCHCGEVDRLSEPTLEFIAHAREDVPALIAEVRRLGAMLLEQESDAKAWRDACKKLQAENGRLWRAILGKV